MSDKAKNLEYPRKRPLSPMIQSFIRHILEGQTQANAYRLAGYAPCDPQQTAVKASQLAARPHVRKAIDDGKKLTAEAFQWSREEMLDDLKRIAKTGKNVDITRAIAQASKMLGYDAPVKSEQSGSLTIRWEE